MNHRHHIGLLLLVTLLGGCAAMPGAAGDGRGISATRPTTRGTYDFRPETTSGPAGTIAGLFSVDKRPTGQYLATYETTLSPGAATKSIQDALVAMKFKTHDALCDAISGVIGAESANGAMFDVTLDRVSGDRTAIKLLASSIEASQARFVADAIADALAAAEPADR